MVLGIFLAIACSIPPPQAGGHTASVVCKWYGFFECILNVLRYWGVEDHYERSSSRTHLFIQRDVARSATFGFVALLKGNIALLGRKTWLKKISESAFVEFGNILYCAKATVVAYDYYDLYEIWWKHAIIAKIRMKCYGFRTQNIRCAIVIALFSHLLYLFGVSTNRLVLTAKRLLSADPALAVRGIGIVSSYMLKLQFNTYTSFSGYRMGIIHKNCMR